MNIENTNKMTTQVSKKVKQNQEESHWNFDTVSECNYTSGRLLLVVAMHTSGAYDEGELVLDEAGTINTISGFSEFFPCPELDGFYPDGQLREILTSQIKTWIMRNYQ